MTTAASGYAAKISSWTRSNSGRCRASMRSMYSRTASSTPVLLCESVTPPLCRAHADRSVGSGYPPLPTTFTSVIPVFMPNGPWFPHPATFLVRADRQRDGQSRAYQLDRQHAPEPVGQNRYSRLRRALRRVESVIDRLVANRFIAQFRL